ncbi:methyltransferase domain-containing protein [Paraflavisolibacter sp. H34]|uniref:class I SAM-dependent methyltransferase n=1 Tax=Huijunlia imazamoxiresistens TaxID=3127457 RepID=UPI00301939AF
MRILYLFIVTLLLLSCAPPFYNSQNKVIPRDSMRQFFAREAELLGFRPGDTVADIGAGDATIDAFFSLAVNNLHYKLVDIDKAWLNERRVRKNFVSYQQLYRSKNTYSYDLVLNTPTHIPLETGSMDKVLCRKTLHEFSDPHRMLNELYRVLGDSGRLMVVEVKPLQAGEMDPGCKKLHLPADSITALLAQHGFELRQSVAAPIVYEKGREMNILTFQKAPSTTTATAQARK